MEKDQKHSEETKLKMRNSHLGKPHPWNKGVPLSQEIRDKISKRHLGKKKSEEHRRNISKGKKGNPLSEEHRQKTAQAMKGKHHSEEWKRKMSIALKGEKNPNWKGGTSSLRDKLRNTSKYVEWRQSCFMRDNFICQKCQIQGGDLEVHHKKPFVKLLNEAINFMPLFSKHEACIFYSPIWDINNGITLCRKCHNKTKRAVPKKTQI